MVRGEQGDEKGVQVLPQLTREMAATSEGTVNLCSRDVLLEMLRFLKRAYWPFAWDTSGAPTNGG